MSEYKKRRIALAEKLENNSFALLASGEAMHKTQDQFHPFIPNRNFFYLTGLKRENFILLLTKDESDTKEFLFIEEATEYSDKWLGKRLTKEEVSLISGMEIAQIFFLADFTSFIDSRILTDSRASLLSKVPELLYLDLFRYKKMRKPESFTYFQEIVNNYSELLIKDLGTFISEQRRVKSPAEIAEIKQAIFYTKKGIEAILKKAKPGDNEGQLEALFEYEIKMAGSEGISFDTIVASKKNATVLHYVDNNQVIEAGSLVLLDLGALANLYAGDISRTFPIDGKFNEIQKVLYELVLDVNKKTIAKIKPGIFVKELNEYAKNLLAEGMIKLGFIKEVAEINRYYYHSVSHYLGLDVHDVGTYQKPLEAGVILTVEPGIYVEEEQIGIRIEDNILVTEAGFINLSQDIPKELTEIEMLMKK